MKVGDEGLEQTSEDSAKTGIGKPSGAETGALRARITFFAPDLRSVIDAWPNLSASDKAAISAIIRGGKPDGC